MSISVSRLNDGGLTPDFLEAPSSDSTLATRLAWAYVALRHRHSPQLVADGRFKNSWKDRMEQDRLSTDWQKATTELELVGAGAALVFIGLAHLVGAYLTK